MKRRHTTTTILFTAVIAAILLCFCSCQKSESPTGDTSIHISWTFSNINRNGEFYTDSNSALHFFDFTSMKEAYVCAKPNCTHSDLSECTAIGMANHPTISGDNIFFFQEELGFNDDRTPSTKMNLYKANLDGSGRIKLSTLEDYRFSHYDRAIVVGNNIYFAAVKLEFDLESYNETGFTTGRIFGCNLETGKFTDYGEVFGGYSANAHIDGFYNGGIYLSTSYLEEKVGYEMFDLEHFEELQSMYKRGYFRLDLNTNTLAESDMPHSADRSYFSHIGGGFYIYMEGDDTIIIDSQGKKTTVKELDSTDCSVVNGFLFTRNGDRVSLELSSGKLFDVNDSVLKKGSEVIYYLDGSYILKSDKGYTKVSKEDLIGDGID